MAAVKLHGWVHASLERVRMGTSFPNGSELNNQITEFQLDPERHAEIFSFKFNG
jgi:hypothetical protein